MGVHNHDIVPSPSGEFMLASSVQCDALVGFQHAVDLLSPVDWRVEVSGLFETAGFNHVIIKQIVKRNLADDIDEHRVVIILVTGSVEEILPCQLGHQSSAGHYQTHELLLILHVLTYLTPRPGKQDIVFVMKLHLPEYKL